MNTNRRPFHYKSRVARLCALVAVVGLGFIVATVPAEAQAPIVYPSHGQSLEQQSKDEGACRTWAQQQTGFNPSQGVYYAPPPRSPGGEVLRGAGRGALLGVIGGAIGGDVGKGALIGTGVGATIGLFGRARNEQASAQSQQQAVANYNALLAQYHRAFSACMSGRGYTVN